MIWEHNFNLSISGYIPSSQYYSEPISRVEAVSLKGFLQSCVLHVHLSLRGSVALYLLFPVPCEVGRVSIWVSLSSLQGLGYFSLSRENNTIKITVFSASLSPPLVVVWEMGPFGGFHNHLRTLDAISMIKDQNTCG